MSYIPEVNSSLVPTPCVPACGAYAVSPCLWCLRRASLPAVPTPCVPACGAYAVRPCLSCLRRVSLSAVPTPCVPACRAYAVCPCLRCLRRVSLSAMPTPCVPACRAYAVCPCLRCPRRVALPAAEDEARVPVGQQHQTEDLPQLRLLALHMEPLQDLGRKELRVSGTKRGQIGKRTKKTLF
ncbi:hypothetical protein Bbelb_387040 [Branchiostoma belcheri]|nr:hypothetical protein Bbelb_387040 [Branchiostoma belcheri]